MSAPNSIEINFKSCHLSVQKSVTVHLRLGCCLRWHFPHRHKIRFCNRAKQNLPTYLLISNTLPLKTPLKTALSYRKSQGLNFGEGILEHGMSWPSQTCPGTACRCFFVFFFRFPSMSILVLNQRGLSTIKGKNVLCDKICLTSRQKCDCGFDKRSQTCTSRHNHLGKFWRLTTLFWKAKVSYNTIATLRITTGKKKHILHCYSV